MGKKFYTVKQVAETLGFSTNTVYKYLDEGRIKATRLGGEGRFRIPESEVVRLLGDKQEGILPEQVAESVPHSISQPVAQVQDDPPALSIQEDKTERLSISTRLGNINLFDWFIATYAIFVGFSSLLFPYYTQDISFEPYLYLHMSIKISLVLLALSYVVFHLFLSKRKTLHMVIQILLGLAFIFLGIPAFETGNYLNASGSFSVAAVILVFAFIKTNDFLKFFTFTLLTTSMAGAIVIFHPGLFPLQSIGQWIAENTDLYILIFIFSVITFLLTGILGYLKSPKVLFFAMAMIGGGSAVYAAVSTSQGFWEQGVQAILFGAFAFIFPLYRKFDSVSKYSKRELVESFAWFIVVLIAGIVLVLYVQNSFMDNAYKENIKALQAARSIIKSDLEQAQEEVSRFGTDKNILTEIMKEEKDIPLLQDVVKGFYDNSSILRRVLVVDKDGNGLAIYPEDSTFNGLDLADRDYFFESKLTKKMIVSDVIRPRTPGTSLAIIISFPLVDDEGNFYGVLGGSVDFDKVGRHLDDLKFGTNGEFVVADHTKKIIINKDPNKLLLPLELDGALSLAVDGQSGNTQSYDEDGTLSIKTYAPIDPYGWGIKAQQPIVELIRNNSRTSFIIFIVTILLGIGSLLSTLYFKR